MITKHTIRINWVFSLIQADSNNIFFYKTLIFGIFIFTLLLSLWIEIDLFIE